MKRTLMLLAAACAVWVSANGNWSRVYVYADPCSRPVTIKHTSTYVEIDDTVVKLTSGEDGTLTVAKHPNQCNYDVTLQVNRTQAQFESDLQTAGFRQMSSNPLT